MKIVITGGHHTSALPVIKKLRDDDKDIQIYWVGHKHSVRKDKNPTLEYKEIIDLNIPFKNLDAGKVYKTKDLLTLLKVPLGVMQAFLFLLKMRPNVILSFGGYIAAPVVFAGFLLGIPSVTHEQTVVAGYANRFISLFAKRILLTWGESKKYFPAKKSLVVGLPLREELFEVGSNSIKTNPNLPTVYITAGKSGSHKINEAVYQVMEELLYVCNIIHQCGNVSIFDDFQRLEERAKSLNTKGKYNLRKFVFADEVGEVFEKADLIVGRAGAHIIYELLTFKKPAILIPIPWVSHNEQQKNAEMLEKAGLATILSEDDLSAGSLVIKITNTLNNISAMGLKKKFKLKRNSHDLIVDEIYKIAKKKKS